MDIAIEQIIILGKFTDGKIRQILIKDSNNKTVTDMTVANIFKIEGAVRVIETPLENLTFESKKDEWIQDAEIIEEIKKEE